MSLTQLKPVEQFDVRYRAELVPLGTSRAARQLTKTANKRQSITNHAHLRSLCQGAAPEIFDRLMGILRCRDDDRNSISAANILLQRGFGQPDAKIDLNTTDETTAAGETARNARIAAILQAASQQREDWDDLA